MNKIPNKIPGGLIPPPKNEKEYVMGAISGVVYENRNTIRNWIASLPSEERQRLRYFDTFACTTYSCLNSLETQMDWLISSKLLTIEDMQWLNEKGYIDVNGKVNFDDRWLALLANNKPGVGNYMNAPWDAARKYGLVPQGAVPNGENMTEAQYYNKSDFPINAYELGKEFLKRFLIQYERIRPLDDKTLSLALSHAPVCIGVPTCNGWVGDAIINYCDWNANHASLLVNIDDKYKYDFDSYEIFLKKLVSNYKIDFAYKGVISPIVSVGGAKKEQFIFHKNLKFGDYDNDVVQLCKRLIEEDCLDSYFPPAPHYGPEVAQGILNYWNKYNFVSWWEKTFLRGRRFGSKTRAHMNVGANSPKYPY